MVDRVVLGATVKSTLTSIRKSREVLDQESLRLATGKRVNSALDQPQNYFNAKALENTASDYRRMLDSMSQGVRTIQESISGVEALEKILNLAELKALEAKEELEKTSSALPDAILANDPVAYFRLSDVNEGVASNLGSLGDGGDGTYTNGVTQGDEILFYGAGGLPAQFSGGGQYIAVPNDDSINQNGPFPERTVELIFNANTVSGRQVLWEEGGSTNSLNIYIDDGLLRVNGRTTNGAGYGPLDISIPIKSGVSYHVAFTQNGPSGDASKPQEFVGYLNGESFGSAAIASEIGNHPNENGIGAVNQNVYFHDDGPIGNSPPRADGTYAFNGQISDVAIYNSILTQDEMQLRYESTSLSLSEAFRQDVIGFFDQIDGLVDDSNYRGVNLLKGEKLVVDFNRTNRSKLITEGRDFKIDDLELEDINFQKPSQVENAIRNIRKAIEQIREFGNKLENDLSIITARQNFTQNTINNNLAGADDLTIADQNTVGANLLAGQVRIDLATTSLTLGLQSRSSVLGLFS